MEWLNKKSYLPNPYKRSLYELATDYKDKLTFFYSINKALVSKAQCTFDQDDDLIFQKKDLVNELIYNNKIVAFENKDDEFASKADNL
ncbi:MAG: hypothetical protein GX206_11810 [Clostridiales bacterium]|nr:hypothetical protein [Clostridiales bacterium]